MSIRTLAKHAGQFFSGNVIGLVLSLVTFPILTRLLSQEQYGIMVLINTMMMMAVAIAKGGTSEGIVRFYGDYAKSPGELRTFTSTVLATRFAQGVIVALLYLAAIPVTFAILHLDTRYVWAFVLMAPYIAVRGLTIVVLNYYRAVGLTGRYNIIGLIQKALAVILSLAALLLISRDLNMYFGAMLLAESAVMLYLMIWLLGKYEFSTRAIAPDLAKTLLVFGIPLAATEVGYLLLQYADRYLLTALASSQELAVYSVGYNIPSYINDAVMFSISYAIVPLYTKIFQDEGSAKVGEFLSKSLQYYVCGTLLACAGYAAVCDDLIKWLASEKYAGSAGFSPVVLFSLMLMGSNYITYAGLFLHKRTRSIMVIMIASVVVNVVANFALIPTFGAAGAAYATLIACIVSAGATVIMSHRLLPFRLQIGGLIYYIVVAATLFLLATQIKAANTFAQLGMRLAFGLVFVVTAVLLHEADLRNEVKKRLGF